MNSNICKTEVKEVTNFGNIKVIGGEKEILQKEAIKGIVIEAIPKSTASAKEIRDFERFIKQNEISKALLKEIEGEFKSAVKEFKTAKATIKSCGRYSPAISGEVVRDYDKSILSKLNCLELISRRKTISMIKPKMVYEINKGDKMVEIHEFKNKYGVIDYSVTHYCDSPETNDGELKNKDLITLYYSKRVGTIRKEKEGYVLEPLYNKTSVHTEEQIVPGIRTMMKYPSLLYVSIRNLLIPIVQLRRKTYSLRDRSKNEISFLLNLKGDAIRVGECSYYDEQALEKDPTKENNWVNLKALSYNMIDYENNHVVVIAREETLSHIDRRVRKLHEEYYDFENEDGDRITGLYGLTKNEESSLKEIKQRKVGFDDSEIKELFEIFDERLPNGKLRINGAQSIINIEHDIRNHERARYILSKSSDELFFLKTALEEIVADRDMNSFSSEYLTIHNYEEVKRYSKKVNQKKLTALINVVSGLHLRYEAEEDMGKYLSDELDEIDKIAQERETGSYKTHRNYYSQKDGVLAPNGDPQETHRRMIHAPTMFQLRNIRAEHRNVLVGEHAGESSPKVLSEIYKGGIGVKTPTTSFIRKYPEYPIKDLGFDLEDKDSLLVSLSQVSGYLSKQEEVFVRTAILEYLGEKYPAPQFRVDFSTKEIDYSKVCSLCKHEKECFLEMNRRWRELTTLRKYSKEVLELDIDDVDIIKGVYEEIKGYLPGYKHIPGEKTFKISIPKRKAIKYGLIEEVVEETSSSNPFIEYGQIGDNLYRIGITINGKEIPVYAKGNIDILDYDSISISGGRTISDETVSFIKHTISDLTDEYVIVSGLALGCDKVAHQTALDNNGMTIAVLPAGFNNIFPAKNKKLAKDILDKGGLLISEYPPEAKVPKRTLVERNKIISGLSNTVIICKGGKGTKHTTDFAKKQGKNILFQNSYKRDEVI